MTRKILLTTTVMIAVALLAITLFRMQVALRPHVFMSGYVVLVSVLFLAAYNVRKKLPFLPLGRSSTWLQVHVYVGWFVIAAFGFHVRWRLPNGWFESVVFWTFAVTATSGIYGLVLSKVVPQRLSRLREEFIYERIPALRLQVQQAAHQAMKQLLQTADAPALADFYSESLAPYFVRPRSIVYYVRPSSRLRNRLRNELSSLERYLTADQRETQRQLARLIDRRDDLDFHHAQQSKLKYWLFFHIAATYTLVTLVLLHAIMAHAFWGGAV